MHILCPHCHNPIEVVKLSPREEIACPSCGSSFRLDAGATTGSENSTGQTIGKFCLIETLGQGAFGTVYKVRDPELDRVVAIKVPRAGNLAEPQELDRFLREARSAAQLRHPSIVPVHDVGQQDGRPYLVSDFVPGVTLADLLSARRPPFREAAEWVATVADALQYAHDCGVVHRDVKPSNIMIGENGSPFVMDFGLAKREAGEITMTLEGQVLGTPAYMPPEQARGEGHAVDGRGDVYSLGVVLFQMLTGELPFRGTQRMLLHQVLHDEPRPPRSLNDHIPRDLQTITLKAMAKEPARRYQTARALADDLRRWLKGEAIQARPAGRVERVWRWCRRKPAVATLLALLLMMQIIIVAGAIGFALYYRQTADRLDVARKDAEQYAGNLAEFRGLTLSEGGNSDALLWLAESLERNAQGASSPEQERFIRTSLAVWAQQLAPRSTPLDLDAPFFSGKFSRDTSRLLVREPIGERSKMAVLDTTDGHKLAVFPNAPPFSVWRLSDDGKTVEIAYSTDQSAKGNGESGTRARHHFTFYDAGTGKLMAELTFDEDSLTKYPTSPDCRYLLIHRPDAGGCRLIQTATKQERCRFETQTGRINVARFSPDGRFVLTGGEDQTARVWDVERGRLLLALEKHEGEVWGGNWSDDGKRIVTACGDRLLPDDNRAIAMVWDASSGKLLAQTVPTHHQSFTALVDVRFVPGTNWIATSKRVGGVELSDFAYWRGESGERIVWMGDFEVPEISRDGRRGIAVRKTASWLFDARTGQPVGSTIPSPGLTGDFSGEDDRPCFSKDGRFALWTLRGSNYRLYDADRGGILGGEMSGSAAAMTPDSRALLLFRSGSANTLQRLELFPVEGSPERITLWVQTLLGKELTPIGEVRPLDDAEREKRRQRLAELGGPPL